MSHTLIAVQFNTANLEEFIRLGVADRLSNMKYCTPAGALVPLSYGGALQHIDQGHNVYADVKVNESGEVSA